MDRLACVDVAALPLQLLLREHPQWRALPAAVVAEDRPGAPLLWVNEPAWQLHILPGMRHAAALALASDLHASVVPAVEIQRALAGLTTLLRRFTPFVEPSTDEPGVFWLDASGLTALYPSLEVWAAGITAALATEALTAAVAVGFHRFGTYALARARQGITLLASPAAERAAAGGVPLRRLGLAPKLRETLERLGVRDVEALLRLPPGGLRERYGEELYRLRRLAGGELYAPLQPAPELPPIREVLDLLEAPEQDVTRLLFRIKSCLAPLLRTLAERGEALAALHLELHLESGHPRQRREVLRPASPTLDEPQLVDLVRLRLERRPPPAPVVEVQLGAESAPAAQEQLGLFARQPRRDLAAANRALARVRAELGGGAVCRAALRAGHLPEAQHRWEPLGELKPAAPAPAPAPARGDETGDDAPAPLVRRVFQRPRLLGQRIDTLAALQGPYTLSGGWWRKEVARDYYFARTREGTLLWIYFDRKRHVWLLHGLVE